MQSRSWCRTVVCLLAIAAGGPGARGGELNAEDFADRWVAAVQSQSARALQALFTGNAVLEFESAGRKRQVDPPHYARLLLTSRADLKDFERRRGGVELTASEDSGKGPTITFL